MAGVAVTLDLILELAHQLPEHFEPLLLSFEHPPYLLDGRWAILGSDEGTELRVDCETGQIWSFDPTGQLPTRFVNTSIGELALSIDTYRAYKAAVLEGGDEPSGSLAADDLRKAIALVDEAAIAHPEAWWALVVDQADDGLL